MLLEQEGVPCIKVSQYMKLRCVTLYQRHVALRKVASDEVEHI